jgi:hypothetical protein
MLIDLQAPDFSFFAYKTTEHRFSLVCRPRVQACPKGFDIYSQSVCRAIRKLFRKKCSVDA